jgi:pyruvate dehydrogenase E1 component alpha subunit
LEEGTFYEAANFAALKRLPVVLVCENNGLSTCTSITVRQPPGRSPCNVAAGIGLPAERGDGNDVLDVLRLARPAIERARDGGGPSFLEFTTYRWREHCGPFYDWNLGYRQEADFLEWQKRCPLVRLQKAMTAEGAWDSAAMEQLHREVEVEIDQALRAAQAGPYPSEDMLLAHEYAP